MLKKGGIQLFPDSRLLTRMLLAKLSLGIVPWYLGISLTPKICCKKSGGHIFCMRELPRELSTKLEKSLTNNILNSWDKWMLPFFLQTFKMLAGMQI